MYFLLPSTAIILIYVGAAVLPAALLMGYIYKKDTVEKEPGWLLIQLILLGVISAFPAILLEMLGEYVLPRLVSPDSPYYTVLLAFVVVAMVEEGCKFFFLKRRTWNDWNFNYRFDGIVYAVFVSLGFAAFENIRYVLSYGLSVALPRALLAVPGHMSFAVFMGVFYGRARLCDDRGNKAGRRANLLVAYLISVLLHGVYDSCAMTGTPQATVIFGIFVAVMYVSVFLVIRRESRTDRPV